MIKSLLILNQLDDSLNLALQGRVDESEKILYSLDQSDPRVQFNLGWHNMRRGKLHEGFLGLDKGREVNVFGGTTPLHTPRYIDQNLKDKYLLFINEGGLGDEIINIRFVKNYYDMGAKVIVASTPALYPIFSKLPYIHTLVDRAHHKTVYHDYWIPAMSAALPLKLEYKDLNGSAYLNYFSPKYFPNKTKQLKVGLKWAGNPKFEHQQYRRFPIENMIRFTEIKNCKFYSLQRDEDLIDRNNPFIDLKYQLKTWKDTAEIIMSMDLIITSCTSVAHLSGAMGKPTWVILPMLPYYIWSLPGNMSPWYNTVKLYRQKKYGEWKSIFDEIYNDLTEYNTTNTCSLNR